MGQLAIHEVAPRTVFIGHDRGLRDDVVAMLGPLRQAGDPANAAATEDEAGAELAIVAGADLAEDAELRRSVRARGIPVLAVFESPPDSDLWVDQYSVGDDWMLRANLRTELAARVECLLRRRPRPGRRPVDGRFFALLIHDLRTPLNVIGLSLRMIGQAVPKGDADLDEDLRFVEENFRQIERMLAQLSDYFRLFEEGEPLYFTEFSPRTLVGEVLENRAVKLGAKGASVRLDVRNTCPAAVTLDPLRARLALQYALTNALAAAGEGVVTVTLRGEAGRWITEIATDRPPPNSVQGAPLQSHLFERLCGTAAERRGMDLAIAARVTEMFQGTARLDADPDRGTTLVLDWPEHVSAPPQAG